MANIKIRVGAATVGTVTIPCGGTATYNGGQSFPSEVFSTVGSDTGYIVIGVNPFEVPDKFVIYLDDIKVADTGYRGASRYQSDLDTALSSKGLPNETIVADSALFYNFKINKTSQVSQQLKMEVYAPLDSTAWNVFIGCPNVVYHDATISYLSDQYTTYSQIKYTVSANKFFIGKIKYAVDIRRGSSIDILFYGNNNQVERKVYTSSGYVTRHINISGDDIQNMIIYSTTEDAQGVIDIDVSIELLDIDGNPFNPPKKVVKNFNNF